MSHNPKAQVLLEAKQKRAALDGEITSLLALSGTDQYTAEKRTEVLEKRQLFNDVDQHIEHLERSLQIEARSSINVNIIDAQNKDSRAGQNFRIVRALNSLVSGKKLTGLESEMHTEAMTEARGAGVDVAENGLWVPGFIASTESAKNKALEQREKFFNENVELRDILVTNTGGNLVPTDLGGLIPFLDPSLTLRKLGATVLNDLVGNLDLPRQTARATSTGVTEVGTLTESNPTFNKLSLTPKRHGTYIETSLMQLMQTRSLSVEEMIRKDLQQAIWEYQEQQALNGSGVAPQVTGILNTVGIGSVVGGTNGAVPDWADVVDLETAVSNANALFGNLGYLTTPGLAGLFKKTLQFPAAGSMPIWEGNNDGTGNINGYRAMTSTLVPSTLTKGLNSDCHAILYGNFSELIMAFWGGANIVYNPYSGDKEGMVRLTINSFYDIGVRRVASFAAMKDARVAA